MLYIGCTVQGTYTLSLNNGDTGLYFDGISNEFFIGPELQGDVELNMFVGDHTPLDNPVALFGGDGFVGLIDEV